MLIRVREGTMLDTDCISLNERVLSPLSFHSKQPTMIIVQRNTLRIQLNRRAVFEFASHLKQNILIFPAKHSRMPDLPLETILAISDGSGIPGLGILFYTQNMPVILNRNISTKLDLVNGTIGIAKGV